MQHKINELEQLLEEQGAKYLAALELLEKQHKAMKLLSSQIDSLHHMITGDGMFKIEEGIEILKKDLEVQIDDRA